MGALAAAGAVLGSWLYVPSSSAQVAQADNARPAGPAAVAWAGFAGNAQHTAVAQKRTQPFHRIRRRAKVDLAPVISHGELPIHYGSPMITAENTVLVPTEPGERLLVGLNATTLKPRFHVLLKDPVSGQPAQISTSSSASPTVGPDGDMYYGVLENPFHSA